MQELLINKHLKWIHLMNPGERDIAFLKERYGIHPIILDELKGLSGRGKVEHYDDYLYLVYHLPIYDPLERTSRRAEIDFVATKDTLITVTYEEIEPVRQFNKDLEGRLKGKLLSIAHLIYYLLQETNDFSIRQLKHIERKVNYVGEELFKHQNRELLEEVSRVKRDVLDFSIIAVPQRTTLESLLEIGTELWGPRTKIYFSDLIGDFLKVELLLQNIKATIESYSETISQIFEFKTSEIIRRFSILGFLSFPLILYATIALQPRVEATFIHTPSDFWIVFGIIIGIILIIGYYFKKKGWL